MEPIERHEQALHEQTQENQTNENPQDGCNHGTMAKIVCFSHHNVFVQNHPNVPIEAFQVGKGGEGHQIILTAGTHLAKLLTKSRALATEQFTVGFSVEFNVWVRNYVAAFAHQKRITRT